MVAQVYINNEHQQIFEETKHIPGWQVAGDSEKLYELAYSNGSVILEIGTFGGRSATVELRGALANPERNTPPQFYGIDIDIQGIWRTLTSLDKENLTDYALLYHGNLQQFVEAFSIRPTMVFLDGDHRYAGVKKDLISLAEFLEPGTPVLCHDYTNPENDTGELGVRQAIDEFVAEGFATFSGTFGCSAFLVMSDKINCPVTEGLSLQEFYQRKSELLVTYALDMQNRWHNSEGDRQARGNVIQDQQKKLADQQQVIQQQQAQLAQSQSVPPLDPVSEPRQQATPADEIANSQKHIEPDSSTDAPASPAALRQKLKATRQELKAVRQQAAQDVADLKEQIAAMESSKFWKMRSLWFRIKTALGADVS